MNSENVFDNTACEQQIMLERQERYERFKERTSGERKRAAKAQIRAKALKKQMLSFFVGNMCALLFVVPAFFILWPVLTGASAAAHDINGTSETAPGAHGTSATSREANGTEAASETDENSGTPLGSQSESQSASQSPAATAPQSDAETNANPDAQGILEDSSSQGTAAEADFYDGALELPVTGATGFASVKTSMKDAPDNSAAITETLAPGTAFLILNESGEWWEVESGRQTGWVKHDFCMVNLPDVIPSIIYDEVNSYEARFVSSGEEIPGITGEQLYSGKALNERFGQDEFIVAVMYSMAKRIYLAQQAALENGESLIIYEGFRPYEVQVNVAAELKNLSDVNADVNTGLNSHPWNINWFIAGKISSHQKGCAIDVSLAKITASVPEICGDYKYTRVTSFDSYENQMPSAVHELSAAAAGFAYPVATSLTGWQNVPLSERMKNSAPAQRLQKYCADAGLTPLVSEWWHFDDLHTSGRVTNSGGDYILSECLSRPPLK